MREKRISDRTMQMWWRRAVLVAGGHKCAVCGRVRPANELDAHHLVNRRCKLLRNDWRNGVPVCRGECHQEAERLTVTTKIIEAYSRRDYLEWKRGFKTVRDYLVNRGITMDEFERSTLEELKIVANGG